MIIITATREGTHETNKRRNRTVSQNDDPATNRLVCLCVEFAAHGGTWWWLVLVGCLQQQQNSQPASTHASASVLNEEPSRPNCSWIVPTNSAVSALGRVFCVPSLVTVIIIIISVTVVCTCLLAGGWCTYIVTTRNTVDIHMYVFFFISIELNWIDFLLLRWTIRH